jgi:hypothetical protein
VPKHVNFPKASPLEGVVALVLLTSSAGAAGVAKFLMTRCKPAAVALHSLFELATRMLSSPSARHPTASVLIPVQSFNSLFITIAFSVV